MKIVYLSASGALGGAETALLGLLQGMRQTRPLDELHVIAAEDGPLLRRLEGCGVTGHVLPFPSGLASTGETQGGGRSRLWSQASSGIEALRYANRLRRLLASLQPDLVHSNGIKMHLLAAWANRRRIPLVWHIHDYVGARATTSKLLRASASRAASAIANSRSVEEDLRSICPRLRSQTIYNAVDTARFSPTGPGLDLDSLSGLGHAPQGVVRVGLIATFAKWKGHKIFLQALRRAAETLPVRGYVVGGPIYQTRDSQYSIEELRRYATELGLDGRVGFTGFVEDVPAAMRSLDVVIHASSKPEPFGMVLAEAMACGKPVVASFAGGACEVVREEYDSLTHQPGDHEQLARQIGRLAADAGFRSELGRRARNSVCERFSIARLGTEMVAFYQDLAGLVDALPRQIFESDKPICAPECKS